VENPGERPGGAIERVERPELLVRLAAGSAGGRARGLMRVWRLWERFASWRWPADPLPGSPYAALRIRRIRYEGRPITLPDSTEIRAGDLIGELHLNNDVLAEIAKVGKWSVMSAVKAELGAAARWASEGDGREVKALFGETIVARTAVWMGFTLIPGRPTVIGRLKRLYLSGLLQIYNPLGSVRLERGSRGVRVPDELWMSREELLSRYR
jgi:peptidoglycan-N-acetylglucosamine deacetylase